MLSRFHVSVHTIMTHALSDKPQMNLDLLGTRLCFVVKYSSRVGFERTPVNFSSRVGFEPMLVLQINNDFGHYHARFHAIQDQSIESVQAKICHPQARRRFGQRRFLIKLALAAHHQFNFPCFIRGALTPMNLINIPPTFSFSRRTFSDGSISLSSSHTCSSTLTDPPPHFCARV